MATKKKTNTRDAPVIDYAPRTNDAVYFAKAIGEALTLPETDRTRVQVYLRKLIEVIEQGSGQSLYKHNIYMAYTLGTTNANIYLSLYSTRDTRYKFDDLAEVIKTEGALHINTLYTCVTGTVTIGGTTTPIYALSYLQGGTGKISIAGTNIYIEKNGTLLYDTVTQIL